MCVLYNLAFVILDRQADVEDLTVIVYIGVVPVEKSTLSCNSKENNERRFTVYHCTWGPSCKIHWIYTKFIRCDVKRNKCYPERSKADSIRFAFCLKSLSVDIFPCVNPVPREPLTCDTETCTGCTLTFIRGIRQDSLKGSPCAWQRPTALGLSKINFERFGLVASGCQKGDRCAKKGRICPSQNVNIWPTFAVWLGGCFCLLRYY